jgi:hypothetical protein
MATSEPVKFVFPLGKRVGHFHLADELVSCFVVYILQGQRLVVDKPAHIALLLLAGLQLVFEGLKPLHLPPSIHIYKICCLSIPDFNGRSLPRYADKTSMSSLTATARVQIPSGMSTFQRDHVSATENMAASELARLSSAASFGSVTVSRGRPCSSRSRHSANRALNSLAFCSAPFVG